MECKSPSLLGVSKKSHDMKGASLMVLQSLVLFYLLSWDHWKRSESKQKANREAQKHHHVQVFCLGLILSTSRLEAGFCHKLLCKL